LARERREQVELKRLEELRESIARQQEVRRKQEEERRRKMDELKKREEEHRIMVEERRRRLQDEENVRELRRFLLPFNFCLFFRSSARTINESFFYPE